MLERRQVSHENLWWAIIRAPLALFYFVAPFVAGILISPAFETVVGIPEWLGTIGFGFVIGLIVYLNGLLGVFFLGVPLYYFLNAVSFQNRWIYLLTGFAGGTVFNFLYPWYSRFLYQEIDVPDIIGLPLTQIAIASYPIIFGVLGMIVAARFWHHMSKEKKVKRKAAP